MQDDTISSAGHEQATRRGQGSKLDSVVKAAGLNQFYPIQEQIFSGVTSGKDVIIRSGTGTGKTTGYGLSLLNLKDGEDQTLIITNSESQVRQIRGQLEAIGLAGIMVISEDDGDSQKQNTNAPLTYSIGSPEAILNALSDGTYSTTNISRVILDNVDEIAARGAAQDLETILDKTLKANPDTQLIFALKAMSGSLNTLIKRFVKAGHIDVPSESRETSGAVHVHLDMRGEVLAKPNALCDILEAEGRPPVLIFCNTPSDTDLVTVILKRRGIRSRKLIGNIPPKKAQGALDELENGTIQAVVITDVAARNLDGISAELVINYSSPNDPEVYLDRVSHAERTGRLRKVITLVNPAEVADFFYLKKCVQFEFEKGELPSQERLLDLRIKSWGKEAKDKGHASREDIQSIVSRIMSDPDKDSILSLLVYSALYNSAQPSRDSDDDYEDRSDRRDSDSEDRYDQEPPRRRERSHRSDDFERGDEAPRRRNQVPVEKEVRLYIGQGSNKGMTKEKFNELLKSVSDVGEAQIKRINIRDNYTFVDFPEELGGTIIDQLANAEFAAGEKLFVKKALTFSGAGPEQ